MCQNVNKTVLTVDIDQQFIIKADLKLFLRVVTLERVFIRVT